MDKSIKSEDFMNKNVLMFFGIVTAGIGSVVGALVGLGLSFTALSPLIIGGIVASIFPAFIAALVIGARCCFRDDINKVKKRDNFVEKRAILAAMPIIGIIVLTDIAIGASIAATANAIFPGVFATWWALAAGAVIGAVVVPVTIVAGLVASKMFGDKIYDYACNPKTSLKDVYIGKEEERGYQSI
ncbi:hypothetical protein [Wolbachia endosymbiont of Folsomia candida]|uniref:hypothetical protein n=1 Tax=Wolbachia endosymbiont of Folsomia candida TaxID=169402 RepID=UPI000ABFF4C3|nr:hypothetical protein [Wolbachia endosymbiont of Folsomia candida]APR98489.1 hypothetical protein ASM33_04460 [Wolbachia endosymbiont of Folsomia candida]